MPENKYTKFVEKGGIYEVWNIVYDRCVGVIKKGRVGRWMHWCLFPGNDTWFSNGCLKEISQFITSLYGKSGEKVNMSGQDENTRKLFGCKKCDGAVYEIGRMSSGSHECKCDKCGQIYDVSILRMKELKAET